MSAKYQRIKQHDLNLPAPLRWLTRAFSSITLAVVLLSLIALYCIVGTMPLLLLIVGAIDLAVGLVLMGGALGLGYAVVRTWPGLPIAVRLLLALLLFAGSAVLTVVLGVAVYDAAAQNPWLHEHRAMAIYRLRGIEMGMLEFFAWWPMTLLLVLFVINMIWATIRRIEFRFVNLGVLTVHGGIVMLAVGSMLYGHFKVEGDLLLYRQDLPQGRFESSFYDRSQPAAYMGVAGQQIMLPLHDLPRYNDYAPGELNIALHDYPAVREKLPENVRVTVSGFIAYGELSPRWRSAAAGDDTQNATAESPAVLLSLGDMDQPRDPPIMLLAGVPAQRVVRARTWEVEYLVGIDPQRRADLLSEFQGPLGLVVELPEHDFRAVYSIMPGRRITLGDTGYTLHVREIGPYEMPFVTEGYQGAADTRAVVEVTGPGKRFTRYAMHRYPERSQDFVPQPDNPGAGPLGMRTEPDPTIRLAFLDSRLPQYHILADSGDDEQLTYIIRSAGTLAQEVLLTREHGIPVVAPRTSAGPRAAGPGRLEMLHLVDQMPRMVRVIEPVPTPQLGRDPELEGQYTRSLLAVRVEADLPASEGGGTWQRTIWMRHMRYPHLPDDLHRPVTLNVPTLGPLSIAFSRQRHELPFALALDAFEMQPYPGSNIPRDFVADLRIVNPLTERTTPHTVHMNNPIIYRAGHGPLHTRKIKISQVGWDPPDPQDPAGQARDEHGRFLNQQRFTVLGIGNNVAINMVALGAIMMVVGIPWAFYVKPMLLRWQKRRIQRELAERADGPPPPRTPRPSSASASARV